MTFCFLGCVGAAAEHESLGDRAYAELRFGDALAEYRLSSVRDGADPALNAKLASAALHAGDLVAAAQAYVALAERGDNSRLMQAADGLERVAQAAVEVGDREALTAALVGLRRIAPRRAVGTLAQPLAREVAGGPPSVAALSVLTYAAAVAPDARLLDSLMYASAVVLRQLGRCEEAVPVLESLVRREREPAVVDAARASAGYCAYTLGRESHDQSLPLSAEQWYRRAIASAGTTAYGRAAYLGLGDVLFARADYVGAAEAYESAMFGAAPTDSIAQEAAAKLNMLGRAGTGIP